MNFDIDFSLPKNRLYVDVDFSELWNSTKFWRRLIKINVLLQGTFRPESKLKLLENFRFFSTQIRSDFHVVLWSELWFLINENSIRNWRRNWIEQFHILFDLNSTKFWRRFAVEIWSLTKQHQFQPYMHIKVRADNDPTWIDHFSVRFWRRNMVEFRFEKKGNCLTVPSLTKH